MSKNENYELCILVGLGCSSSELIIIEINSESEFQQHANWNEVINQVKKLWHVV